MPDKYGFNILVDWGRTKVQCIEEDCNAGGHLFEWNEERRKVHFLTHNYDGLAHEMPGFKGIKRTDNCRLCGTEFEQERKRGRPRVLCYLCKPE